MMDDMFCSAPGVAENLGVDVALAKSPFSTDRNMLRFWWGYDCHTFVYLLSRCRRDRLATAQRQTSVLLKRGQLYDF